METACRIRSTLGSLAGVGPLQAATEHAGSLHRVPDAEVVDPQPHPPVRPATGEGTAELTQPHPVRVARREQADGIRDEVLGTVAQEAEFEEHPAEGPRRVGASAEAEDEDVVAVLVVAHEELVGLAEVLAQPQTEPETEDLRRGLAPRGPRP